MKLQVLVATMHQRDLSIAEKMNIRCGAVIANQAECEEVVNQNTQYGTWKMITTPTRGVGLNRNIALMASSAEILLMSDDDVIYNDDMAQRVVDAFSQIPEADVIIFGMDMVKSGFVIETRKHAIHRLHVWNSMRFGTYRIAVRRKALLDHNITFHQRFGGGCDFSAGEDSLFLKECFDNRLKVYSHDYVLGSCCKDVSSWFFGYNEKYFYDKGVLVRNLFPKSAYIMALYFGIRFKRKTDIGVFRRLKLIYLGIKGGKHWRTYGE
ncbi:MAG: glycosyltransferase [Clostridia bacterium]|nr:glycosyltransferase [Clostridia bacterium]